MTNFLLYSLVISLVGSVTKKWEKVIAFVLIGSIVTNDAYAMWLTLIWYVVCEAIEQFIPVIGKVE